jgi:opacity protein-like surface antigen
MTLFVKIGSAMLATVLLGSSVYAKDRDKVIFLDAGGGYSQHQYSTSGTLTDVSEPDENGIVYGGALGFRLTDNYFFTLNYQKNALENVEFDNMFLTANFRFRFRRRSFAPYAGLLAGASIMHWDTPPVQTVTTVEDSTSLLVGAQFGTEYILSPHWQLYGAYQYVKVSHKTKIVDEGSIKYNDAHHLILGLRFGFIDP